MSWSVEGLKGKRYGCFAKARAAALKVARQRRRPVRVAFHGRKPSHNNRHIAHANFLMHPNGKADPTIDPTWYTHKPKKG